MEVTTEMVQVGLAAGFVVSTGFEVARVFLRRRFSGSQDSGASEANRSNPTRPVHVDSPFTQAALNNELPPGGGLPGTSRRSP